MNFMPPVLKDIRRLNSDDVIQQEGYGNTSVTEKDLK